MSKIKKRAESWFNKGGADPTKLREERCVGVAKQVLKLIAEYEGLKLGDVKQEELIKYYKDLVQDIKALYLKENILLSDIAYIKKLLLQPIEVTDFLLNQNFNKLLGDVQDKLWGKDRNEATVGDLDRLLKDEVEEELETEE